MHLPKHFSMVAAFSLACAAAHAQTAPATPEALYTALTGRIDGVVSQNAATADLTAKMYTCNKMQMFYSPDTPGADAQGCIGGAGGGGLHWNVDPSAPSGCVQTFLAERQTIPACPKLEPGAPCSKPGSRCRITKQCGASEHGVYFHSHTTLICG